MQHRVMLDDGGDDMLSLLRIGFCGRLDGPVIRLASACGKINLVGRGAQTLRDGFPYPADRLLTLRSQRINAAGVSVMLRKIREHGFHHLRRSLRCRRIIQINDLFHRILLFLNDCIRSKRLPHLFRGGAAFLYSRSIPSKPLRFTEVTIPLPPRSVNCRRRIYLPKEHSG